MSIIILISLRRICSSQVLLFLFYPAISISGPLYSGIQYQDFSGGTKLANIVIVCVFMGIAEGTKNGELCFFYL